MKTLCVVLEYPTESVDEDEEFITDDDEQIDPLRESFPLCLSAAEVFRREVMTTAEGEHSALPVWEFQVQLQLIVVLTVAEMLRRHAP